MNPWLILVAILPGLLISVYIYYTDLYEKESRVHLLFAFLLGMAATVPMLYFQKWSNQMGWDQPDNLVITLFSSFVIVALGEEAIKFILLLIYPFHRPFFNEPLDGIIYAVMISMGFATLENILYASRFGLETTILRAFTAVPAHAVCGVIIGYYAGLAKFDPGKRWYLLFTGLGLAVFIHGTYDFFILQEAYEWLIILAILTLWISIYFARKLIRNHQENSPFRT